MNEQRDGLKDDLDKIRNRTETAVDTIMNDAKDTIDKIKCSQPGYEEKKKVEPEGTISKDVQTMHD